MDGETPNLIYLIERIVLVHTKRFDREHLLFIFLIGKLPNISESSGCGWSFVGRLAEREGDCVGSRENPT